MKWSESTTLEFVKIYLKQECLWNSAHGAYKLKYKRENAYATIVAEFKDFTGKIMSVSEVKNKIKNLRTTYSQEVHKILQKSSPDSIYAPSLVWFQEMDRCLKHVSYKRQACYKYDNSDIPDIDSSSYSIWADHGQDLHNSNFEDANPDPLVCQNLTDNEYDTGLPNETLSIVKIERLPLHHKRRMKKKKPKHKPIQTNAIDSQSESLERDDEFDIYGKFIATQLRQIDLNKALRIQLAIQNLLSEARLSEHGHT